MREVRHTFEHLLVILLVFVLCVAIIFAIPAVRIWFLQNVPGALANMAGPASTSRFMAGVNPQLVASTINDDESRADLIALWKKSIPEMDPDAVADLVNESLADPNMAALMIDVISQMDESQLAEMYNALLSDPAVADFVVALIPKLDGKVIANLVNELVAADETVSFVNGLIQYFDSESLGIMINAVISSDKTVDALVDLIGSMDGEQLGKMINTVLAEASKDGSKVAEFLNAVIKNSDTQKVAVLVDRILGNVEVDAAGRVVLDEEGNPVSTTADMLGKLFGSIDAVNCATVMFQMLDHERYPDTVNFIANVLSNINPGSEVLYVLDRLFTPGQGLHKLLWGELGVNDAIMDYLYLEAKLEYLMSNGVPLADTQPEMFATYTENLVREVVFAITGNAATADWYKQNLGVPLGAVVGPMLGQFIAWLWTGFFQSGAYYCRFTDVGFGTRPPWQQPNGWAWADKYGYDPNKYYDPAFLPQPWEEK